MTLHLSERATPARLDAAVAAAEAMGLEVETAHRRDGRTELEVHGDRVTARAFALALGRLRLTTPVREVEA